MRANSKWKSSPGEKAVFPSDELPGHLMSLSTVKTANQCIPDFNTDPTTANRWQNQSAFNDTQAENKAESCNSCNIQH